jgi:hypothetical protein
MLSSVGRALDSKSKSRQFKSGSVHHVTLVGFKNMIEDVAS